MVQGLNEFLNDRKAKEICRWGGHLPAEKVNEILSRRIRTEKVAIKDIKLRTFISEGNTRTTTCGRTSTTSPTAACARASTAWW